MGTGKTGLVVRTIAACLLGGLLTVGVVCSADQEGVGLKAEAEDQSPQGEPTDTGNHQEGNSPGDDASQRDEELDAEHRARAVGYLRKLDGLEEGVGSPMGRVASLFEMLEHRECAGGVCQQARQLVEDYVRARAGLIRQMLEGFLASNGADDGAPERQELASLHAAFTAAMAASAEPVPMLASLPDVLATTLGVPDFLDAPPDDAH